jgi:hypothetical protein
VPIIIAFSPYGKGGSGANLMDVVPYRVGVPKSRQSGLEKFEGSVLFSHLSKLTDTRDTAHLQSLDLTPMNGANVDTLS